MQTVRESRRNSEDSVFLLPDGSSRTYLEWPESCLDGFAPLLPQLPPLRASHGGGAWLVPAAAVADPSRSGGGTLVSSLDCSASPSARDGCPGRWRRRASAAKPATQPGVGAGRKLKQM